MWLYDPSPFIRVLVRVLFANPMLLSLTHLCLIDQSMLEYLWLIFVPLIRVTWKIKSYKPILYLNRSVMLKLSVTITRLDSVNLSVSTLAQWVNWLVLILKPVSWKKINIFYFWKLILKFLYWQICWRRLVSSLNNLWNDRTIFSINLCPRVFPAWKVCFDCN